MERDSHDENPRCAPGVFVWVVGWGSERRDVDRFGTVHRRLEISRARQHRAERAVVVGRGGGQQGQRIVGRLTHEETRLDVVRVPKENNDRPGFADVGGSAAKGFALCEQRRRLFVTLAHFIRKSAAAFVVVLVLEMVFVVALPARRAARERGAVVVGATVLARSRRSADVTTKRPSLIAVSHNLSPTFRTLVFQP
ncbi:hypothetical protein EBR66_08380 [bacterium]|nr:hypothetical protein [bacterium]